uniref:Anthocyanin acyltransferase n=1 Tax=Kalanchoe fedtschenkoi TaxID=63787 RepID=A0A7N0VBE2_KALFE
MAVQFEVKVLEHCRVSPPPNSVPTTSLPLTFFDIPWLLCRPMQRILLYEFGCSTAQFVTDVLPQLKHSLSLALQLFFPLSAAECGGVFSDLLRGGLRDAKEIHPLVPPIPIPPSRILNESLLELTPLLALQVTLFPNMGICVGIQFNHVVADGMACTYFLKTWASLFQSRSGLSCIDEVLPVVDRGVIKDTDRIEDVLLNQWRGWGSPRWKDNAATVGLLEEKVRATFVLTRGDIEKLKNWVSGKCISAKHTKPVHISSFVVACAFTWVCVIKSQDKITNDSFGDEDLCHFSFVADCRNRKEISVPSTYFGNCLAICFVSVKRGLFRGEDSIALAADAIGRRVQELESGVLVGAEKWLLQWNEVSETGDLLTVAGSPRLALYETDFGWGRPRLVEMVQIDASGAMYLTEARNEKGGVEVGLARSRAQLEAFSSIFQLGKDQLQQC